MRKIIAFVILFISLVVNAQGANRFSETEDAASINAMESSSREMTQELDDENPPNPGPVPIDDYLPLLLITAVGIIVHAGCRKRKQTA